MKQCTYEMTIRGFDWGCCVTDVRLCFAVPYPGLVKENFAVKEIKQAKDDSKAPEFPVDIAE